jgi:hypothetical protein
MKRLPLIGGPLDRLADNPEIRIKPQARKRGCHGYTSSRPPLASIVDSG